MARKVIRITMPVTAGRDANKVFVVTEMPARKGHAWATRALFGLMNAGVELPDDLQNGGFAALAAMGVQALTKIPAAVGQPLLEELLDCVTIQPGKSKEVVRALIEDDTEEVLTLFLLQKEVLALHVNFSTPASPLTSEYPETVAAPNSSNTPMSPVR